MNTLITSLDGNVVVNDQLSRPGTPRISRDRSRISNSISSPGRTSSTPVNGGSSSNNNNNNSPILSKPSLSRHGSAPSTIASKSESTSNSKKMTTTLPPSKSPSRSSAAQSQQLPPRSPTFAKKANSPSSKSFSSFSSVSVSADDNAASAVATKNNNFQVIQSLEKLSQQEAFRKSLYFRGIFTRGIDNVKRHTNKITTVQEALDMCFDVSEDMKKVIAAKVHADEVISTLMVSPPGVLQGGDDEIQGFTSLSNNSVSRSTSIIRSSSSNNKPKPYESSPLDMRKLKPWEERDGSNRLPCSPLVKEYMQQIEARIHRTYSYDGNTMDKRMENIRSSVSRADAAIDNVREALVSPRLIRRKKVTIQNAIAPLLLSPRSKNLPKEVHDDDAHSPAASEAETKAKPLFSGSEHMVKELELLEDRKRMTLELEQNRNELNRQKEEIETFNVAMAEAERAVQMLEESVRKLTEATNAKDKLIAHLESEAKEGNIISADKESAHQEQVEKLTSALAQLNILVKEMDAESKEVDVSLAEALEKYNQSEIALKELQLTMAKNEAEHVAQIQELEKERDDLAKDLKACRESMESSNSITQKMNGIMKEKDKLIDSLNSKIEKLESEMEEMKERKLQVDILAANIEKDLNQKIHELATTLTEKDEKMTVLQKEIEELKKSSKKGKRAERESQRRTSSRHRVSLDDSRRSSSESEQEESSGRNLRKSSHRRRSHNDETRAARSYKADRVVERVRYATPEPYYYPEERDDRYGYAW